MRVKTLSAKCNGFLSGYQRGSKLFCPKGDLLNSTEAIRTHPRQVLQIDSRCHSSVGLPPDTVPRIAMFDISASTNDSIRGLLRVSTRPKDYDSGERSGKDLGKCHNEFIIQVVHLYCVNLAVFDITNVTDLNIQDLVRFLGICERKKISIQCI